LNLDVGEPNVYGAVYLNSTFNWLAINNTNQIVIVSLHLGTEAYQRFKLPTGFDEVPQTEPTLCVLGGFLCFLHCFKKADLLIWKMNIFGVQDSWTLFLKITIADLVPNYDFNCKDLQLVPLLLSDDSETLILCRHYENGDNEDEGILYNCRHDAAQRTQITPSRNHSDPTGGVNFSDQVIWCLAKAYVESLVSFGSE